MNGPGPCGALVVDEPEDDDRAGEVGELAPVALDRLCVIKYCSNLLRTKAKGKKRASDKEP